MKQVAILGPREAVEQTIKDADLSSGQIFDSEGIDGVQITTVVVDMAQIIVPSAAAILAAKIANRRDIKIKIDGIEVSGRTEEEVLRTLKMQQSFATMAIDTYIRSTRRNLDRFSNRGSYSYCEELVKKILRDENIEFEVCYSPDRRTELVFHDGIHTLIYDRYLGQTLNSIGRIAYEYPHLGYGFHFACKMLSEFFLVKGRIFESALFAMLHAQESDDSKIARQYSFRNPIRTGSTHFQEAFLCSHEAVHKLAHDRVKLYEHAKEIVEELLAQHEDRRKGFRNALGIKRFLPGMSRIIKYRFPSREDMSEALVDELTCDLMALDLTTLFMAREKKGSTPVVALSCFQALKSLQFVDMMRSSVDSYCGKKEEKSNFDILRNDLQIRSGAMNFWCNNPEVWDPKVSFDIFEQIQEFIYIVHDSFGAHAIQLSKMVHDGSFAEVFSDTNKNLKEQISAKDLSEEDLVDFIDDVCGWPKDGR
jgi:hypothetical protein